MNKSLPIILVLLLVAFAIVVFFAYQGPTGEAEAVELRVYEVPQEYHNDLSSCLRNALNRMGGKNSELVGRVTSGPNNTLVVTATPKIHRGIEEFLADLEMIETPPAQPVSVSMTYWFIVGRPVEQTDPGKQYKIGSERHMESLASALTQIASVQGPMEFRLLEQIQLTSIGHNHAQLSGKLATVEQQATSISQDSVVAQVSLRFDKMKLLRSEIMLEPEQLLVIGQTGFASRELQPFGPGVISDDAMLYYVVTANLEQ